MGSYDWLEKLKEGDPIIVRSYTTAYVAKVFRLTNTQVIVSVNDSGSTKKFRRSTGAAIGESSRWFHSWLAQANSEEIAKIRENELRKRCLNKVSDAAFKTFTTDALKAIASIIDEQNKLKEITSDQVTKSA